MIADLLDATVIIGIIASGIRLAAPFLFAALGETFSQRSGVLNLGVEGIMLMGAFSAFFVTLKTSNPWTGLASAMLVGALMGLIMAFISVTLKAEQGISGIGLYLFGLGMSALLFRALVGSAVIIQGFQPVISTPSRLTSLAPNTSLNLLQALELGLYKVVIGHDILVYLAFLLVPISAFILNKTTFGLKIRAVGQNPQAADSLGISVDRVRYITVIFSGVMSGIAGASLSIALQNGFQQNMTAGQGFIVVALVYFGGWRPSGILLGALIFSLAIGLQNWVQVLGIPLPYELAVMIPYVLTIVALIFAAQRVQQPAALTRIFERGES
jgi:general nucleoside transport system permease protein